MARPREFDEEKVLESALFLFWEKGLARTTIDDILAATHLGRASFYNAYETREALFEAAVLRFEKKLELAFQALFKKDGVEAIEFFFHSLVDNFYSGRKSLGCFILVNRLGSGNDPIFQKVDQRLDILFGRIQKRFAEITSKEVGNALLVFMLGLGAAPRYGQSKRSLHNGVDFFLRQIKRKIV